MQHQGQARNQCAGPEGSPRAALFTDEFLDQGLPVWGGRRLRGLHQGPMRQAGDGRQELGPLAGLLAEPVDETSPADLLVHSALENRFCGHP